MKILITNILLVSSIALTGPAYSEPNTTHATKKQEQKVERTLWGAKISPYVRKVQVTLFEKGIKNYEHKEILPENLLKTTSQEVPVDFKTASPLGKIPAYTEMKPEWKTPFHISDSSVIMEYFNQSITDNPLRPTCPYANAKVSWLVRYADDVVAAVTHKVLVEKVVKPNVLKQETDEALVNKLLTEELPVALAYLEDLFKDNRNWIANTKVFSLADIAIVSHLVTLKSANVDLMEVLSKYPKLKAYVTKVLARDSFKSLGL